MVTHVRTLESREDALVRLAAKARTDGIKLYRDRRDGRHYASSRSRPGQLHYVTGISCTCEGFIHHQRCAHLGALLAHLGWIDGTPEPTPAASCSTCGECGGLGEVQDLEVRQHGRFVMQWASCTACAGTGQRTAAAA